MTEKINVHILRYGPPHVAETALAPEVPDWATHIICSRTTNLLYYANHTDGEREWYLDGRRFFEFHPDGYNLVRKVTR